VVADGGEFAGAELAVDGRLDDVVVGVGLDAVVVPAVPLPLEDDEPGTHVGVPVRDDGPPLLAPEDLLAEPEGGGQPLDLGEIEPDVRGAVVRQLVLLLDLVELDERAERLEVHALVEVFHLGLEFEVGELAVLEVLGHVGEFAEPLVDGGLDGFGEEVVGPEQFEKPEGDGGPEQPGVELAAGLHGSISERVGQHHERTATWGWGEAKRYGACGSALRRSFPPFGLSQNPRTFAGSVQTERSSLDPAFPHRIEACEGVRGSGTQPGKCLEREHPLVQSRVGHRVHLQRPRHRLRPEDQGGERPALPRPGGREAGRRTPQGREDVVRRLPQEVRVNPGDRGQGTVQGTGDRKQETVKTPRPYCFLSPVPVSCLLPRLSPVP
jgi:hypothetical protein